MDIVESGTTSPHDCRLTQLRIEHRFDNIVDVDEQVMRQLGDEELLAELVEGETALRRSYASQLELLGELLARGVAQMQGYQSPARLLQELVRVSRAEAERRILHAEAVTAAQPGPSRSAAKGYRSSSHPDCAAGQARKAAEPA